MEYTVADFNTESLREKKAYGPSKALKKKKQTKPNKNEGNSSCKSAHPNCQKDVKQNVLQKKGSHDFTHNCLIIK